MAGRKSKEKIGFKDLVTFAKAGWTPEETNALLDRLDSMGDPNDPDMVSDEDDADDTDEDNNSIDDNIDTDDDVDDDSDSETDEAASSSDKASEGAKKNLDRMKDTSIEVLSNENERLKNELKKLRAKNRRVDLSGQDDKKTNSESLIDAFQSCF